MIQPNGIDEISLVIKNIPQHLRNGAFFRSLRQEDQVVKIPQRCYKPNLDVRSQADVQHLLSTLQYWGVDALPGELVEYILMNPEIELHDVLTELSQFNPFLMRLHVASQERWPTEYARVNYCTTSKLKRSDDSISDILVILKWQFQREQGIVWNEKTCSIAAQEGWLDCLTFLHTMGCPWDDKTCSEAAGRNHLKCLEYAHMHGCPWNADTTANALRGGYFECYQYARDQGCPVDELTCAMAAKTGKIGMLQDLHERGCKWDSRTCANAASMGSMECLLYAREHGCPWDASTCSLAAVASCLDILKYAHENGCPWDPATCRNAVFARTLDCLQYAHEQGCPWNEEACWFAAQRPSSEYLRYAHENGCPWDVRTVEYAAKFSVECLKYALDHNCPGSNGALHYAVRKVSILQHLHEERHLPLTAGVAATCAGYMGKVECLRYLLEHGCPVDEKAMRAAVMDIEKVKLLREFGCPWDATAMQEAAKSTSPDKMESLRYCLENGCPGRDTISITAGHHLPALQLVYEHGCPLLPGAYERATLSHEPLKIVQFLYERGVQWHDDVCQNFAYSHAVGCLRFAHEHGAPWDAILCAKAAGGGLLVWHHRFRMTMSAAMQKKALACLRFLHESGCPWDARTCEVAAYHSNQACLEYALAHGCPRSWVRQTLRGVKFFITMSDKNKAKPCKECLKSGLSVIMCASTAKVACTVDWEENVVTSPFL